MQFQVTDIEFGFDDDIDDDEKQGFVNQTMTTVWEADDEDDLVEEITCATGFSVKSIDYRHILK